MQEKAKEAKPPWMSAGYRADIDGLRAISILAVLFFHAYPGDLKGGFIGVDVFFVISGYLIGGLIYAELEAGTFSFASFYARRVRRIFPALICVMAFVYLVGWNTMYPAEFQQLGSHIAGASVFVANFVLLNEVGYFDVEAHTKPLLHLWSLAIEEQFYLVWPLFAALMWRRKSLFVAVTVLLSIVSFTLNVTAESTSTAFYSPQTRFWELAAGVLVARIPREISLRWLVATGLGEAACVLGLALIAIAAWFTPVQSFPGWWVLLPVSGASLVIASGPHTWASRRLLASPPMVFVGKISYPLYLWHWPLFAFAWVLYGATPSSQVNLPLIAASFVLAWLTYALVEKPIRFGVRQGRAVGALAGLVLVLGGGGLLTLRMNGIDSRSVAETNRQLAKDIGIPTASRTSDGSCAKPFGIETGDAYVCFVRGAKPRLLFVGDSVSMAMFSAIHSGQVAEAAILVAANSFQWRRPDCLKPVDFTTWRQGSDTCQNVVRDALKILERQPSIEAVVIPTFTNNPIFSNPARLEAFQQAVLALGKKVIYVSSVPEFYRAPGGCKPRQVVLFGADLTVVPDADACREARPAIEAKMKPQWALFMEVAKGNPNIAVYDSVPGFCDGEYCYQSDSQGVLFWSFAHVNERGSARVLEDFLPWLDKVLRGNGGRGRD